MIAPAAVLLLAFVFLPAILGFGLAFTNARLISPRPVEFVGMDNFARLFTDPTFWRALLNVSYFAVVVVPVQSGLALAMALLINKKFRGVNFFRTVYFLPVVTSMVVVSLLWLFMYRKDGLINELLSTFSFGLIQGADWLNDPATAMPAIIALSIWQAAGFHMIIWLAGLQSIFRRAVRGGPAGRGQPLAPVPVRDLARPQAHPQPGPGDNHHPGPWPLRPGQRHDAGRPARLHHHHHLRGGPLRLQAAGDLLRFRHLARILRPGTADLRGPALPDPREGLT
jgi:hypothetical protein